MKDWKSIFNYDRVSGQLTWLPRNDSTPSGKRWNTMFSGRIAGNRNKCSYGEWIRITMSGRSVYAHRVIWEIEKGPIPDGMYIDHIDCDGLNNRIENLRLATHSQNCMNRRLRSDSSSGIKGVSWNGFSWSAQIRVNGSGFVIGRFKSKEDARIAYEEAAKVYHGEFARIK